MLVKLTPGANSLAYLASSSVTKKKKVLKLFRQKYLNGGIAFPYDPEASGANKLERFTREY